MTVKEKILVAGSTGYLGQFIIKALKEKGYWIRALCRDALKLQPVRQYIDEVYVGEVTEPETLKDLCKDIDIVFSALGITKQKDGLSYMDVDYQGNVNILNEAIATRVSKFIYVSVLNADKLKHLEIVKAKEKFVDELKAANIPYVIIRPNGFFSDIKEVYEMAKKGRIYLFGDGNYRANPIHGMDLAHACVENLQLNNSELDIGGPEVLSQNEIASQAFEALSKEKKITYIPPWLKSLVLKLIRGVTSVKTYGPIEFFMTVLVMDMVAPTYGERTLKQYFIGLKDDDHA
jgi:uncharacterized protein YbjT (DUF2867 family)